MEVGHEGAIAADFAVQSTTLSKISANGSGVILVFFPDCSNLGSVTEIKGFVRHYYKFKDLGFEIIGITNSCTNHALFEFSNNLGVDFHLINDAQHHIAREYGVLPRNPVIRKHLRRTFIVSPELSIIKYFDNIQPIDHAEEVLDYLTTLSGQNFMVKEKNLV